MLSKPVLPLFLQKDHLSRLNNQLYDKTGCFAFLCTDMVVCATNPASWQDAFSIIVPGLYSVYHDYACQFLSMLLDSKIPGFQPDGFSVPYILYKHINTILYILRPNIAHGILYRPDRVDFQNKLSNYMKQYYREKGQIPIKACEWPSLVIALNEEQWKYVVMKIVNDSNQLFHHLENWSLEWEKRPAELPKLKKLFSSDQRFIHSFDSRICCPIVKACLKEANKSKDLIGSYVNNDSKNPSPMLFWQQEMVKLFLNGNKPNTLYAKLEKIIRDEINPDNNRSSISIAKEFNLLK